MPLEDNMSPLNWTEMYPVLRFVVTAHDSFSLFPFKNRGNKGNNNSSLRVILNMSLKNVTDLAGGILFGQS